MWFKQIIFKVIGTTVLIAIMAPFTSLGTTAKHLESIIFSGMDLFGSTMRSPLRLQPFLEEYGSPLSAYEGQVIGIKSQGQSP